MVAVPPPVSTIFNPAVKLVPVMVSAWVGPERGRAVGLTVLMAGETAVVVVGAGAGAAVGAVTARFAVAEVFPSGFTTCRVQVRAAVPTVTATEMAVAVWVVGVSCVTVPPL